MTSGIKKKRLRTLFLRKRVVCCLIRNCLIVFEYRLYLKTNFRLINVPLVLYIADLIKQAIQRISLNLILNKVLIQKLLENFLFNGKNRFSVSLKHQCHIRRKIKIIFLFENNLKKKKNRCGQI